MEPQSDDVIYLGPGPDAAEEVPVPPPIDPPPTFPKWARVLLGVSMVLVIGLGVIVIVMWQTNANTQSVLDSLLTDVAVLSATPTPTATGTPTPEISLTPTPTATPTPTLTASPEPTLTLVMEGDDCLATVNFDDTPLYVHPDSQTSMLETLMRDQQIVVLSRVESDRWYRVRTSYNYGWVYYTVIELADTEPCRFLPVATP